MIPQHVLITIAVLAGVFIASVLGFKMQSNLALAALVAFAPTIYLVSRPDVWLTATIALFASTVTLPGLPENLNAFYMFAFSLCVLMVAQKIINKNRSAWHTAHYWLLGLAFVLLFTASVRGFGLRILGDSKWGGAQYIQLFIGIGLVFATRDINVSPKLWRRCVVALCLLSTLPSLAQAIYALSGGRFYYQYYFIVPDYGAVGYMRGLQAGSGLTRMQIANVTSSYIFTLALLARSWRKSFLFCMALIVASFLLAGISGHRIAVVYNLMVAGVFALMRRNTPLFTRLITPYTLVLGVALVVLALSAQELPLSFQRSLSWIPFIQLSPEATLDASGTISWRFDVWRLMLEEIPKYLLLGKGFAFSASDLPTFFNGQHLMNSNDFVMTSRNYHNGMLSLLLDLGAAGFACGVGFSIAALRMQWKNLNSAWHDTTLGHFHRVMFACFVAQIVVYFVLAGGATSFVGFFVYFIVMEGLVAADKKTADAPARAARNAAIDKNLRFRRTRALPIAIH
ncbi:MAG: hypothetical protein V1929_10980 [bacterium]